MPLFYALTGRTRTLTLSKNIDYSSGMTSSWSSGEHGGSVGPDVILRWYPNASDPSFILYGEILVGASSSAPTPPAPAHVSIGAVCRAQTPAQSTYNSVNSDGPVAPDAGIPMAPACTTLSTGLSGSIVMTVQVQEYQLVDTLDNYDSSLTQVVDGFPFPVFGGDVQGDSAQALYSQYLEGAVPASTITVTTASNGVSVSASYTVPSSGFPIDYLIQDYTALNIDAGMYGPASESGSISTKTDLNGVVMTGAEDYSNADGATNISVSDIGGISISGAAVGDSADYALAFGACNYGGTPEMAYDLEVRLRSWTDTGPALVVDVQSTPSDVRQFTGPNISQTITQKRSGGTIEVRANADDQTYSLPSFAERNPIRLWLDGASLSASGNDPRDWRLQIVGKAFPSFTIFQDGALEVASAQSVTSTVTLSQQRWDGYRFLQFTADQNGTLVLTNLQGQTKSYPWKVAVAGTAQTISLDLCSPRFWSLGDLVRVDTRASRFPLVDPSLSILGEPDEQSMADDSKGANWGIFEVSSAQIIDIGGDTPIPTVNVGAINLLRLNNSKATFLPKFLPDFYGWTDASSNTYSLAPFLTLESDGKQVVDWPASELISSGGDSVFNFETLTSFIGFINFIPGWHATAASSFPDAWHNNSNCAFFAWGSGSICQDGAWIDGIDVDVNSSGLQVLAQPLYDQVQGYPGIGDPALAYQAPGPSQAMPVRCTKFLRAQSWGLTFDVSDGSPLADATVSATEYASPYASYGTGTSDSQGEYKTLAPYVPGNIDYKTEIEEGVTPYPFTHRAWLNRGRLRVTFGGQQKPCPGPQRR